MLERYDYYTEEQRLLKENSREAEAEALRKTPEEKTAEAEDARNAINKIISECTPRCTYKIVNPQKMKCFLGLGEELRKIAETDGAIVEISIDEQSWIGNLVYQNDCILHTVDSLGDTTRFVLAKILLAYECISFTTWAGGVQFTAIAELYEREEIAD